MKTPTTVTAIAWNYCQNTCPYCVASSNGPEWKLNGRSEIWKPKGEELENFHSLAHKYGLRYHETMCPEPEKYLNAKDVLDFDSLAAWIKRHRSGAHLHISGGEPLLRPDIERQVGKVCREFETTIVTNGQLISERPALLNLPIKWLVTWHRSQVSLGEFVEQITLIKDAPHLITVVLERGETWEPPPEFKGFNFEKRWRNGARLLEDFEHNPEDLQDIASHRILLVQPNGCIVGCNKTHKGPFDRYDSPSNIHTGKCDERDLRIFNQRARLCVLENRCSAYQTAVTMARIPIVKKELQP